MAAARASGEVALEVHLPEVVRRRSCSKRCQGPGCSGAPIARACHGGAGSPSSCSAAGTASRTLAAHHLGDLAPAPGIVALRPDRQNSRLGLRRRPARAELGPPRAVCQTGHALPFDNGRSICRPCGALIPKRRPVRSRWPQLQCQQHKLFALLITDSSRQGIGHLPSAFHHAEQVSPMSPNAVTHVSGLHKGGGLGRGSKMIPSRIASQHSRCFASASFLPRTAAARRLCFPFQGEVRRERRALH